MEKIKRYSELRKLKSLESSLICRTKSSSGVNIKKPVPMAIIAITEIGKNGRKTRKK